MRGFASGSSGGKDIHGFYQKADMPVGTKHYHQAGALCGTGAFSDVTPTADKLHAFPIIFPVATTLLNLHIAVVGARAGAKIRLGLYDSTNATATPSGANTYPNNLLYDGGELDGGAAATYTVTPNYLCAANVLYYAVDVFSNGGAGVPVVRGVPDWGVWNLLGHPNGTAAGTYCWQATFAYAALPATFPTAGSTAYTAVNSPAPMFSFV